MRYAAIQTKIWADNGFRGLSRAAQYLWLYLLSSPHSNLIGYYWLPVAYIQHDTGLLTTEIEDALQELYVCNMILYDGRADVVLLKNYLRHNPLRSPKQLTSAIKTARLIPSSSLLGEFILAAKQHTRLENWTQLQPGSELSTPLSVNFANEKPVENTLYVDEFPDFPLQDTLSLRNSSYAPVSVPVSESMPATATVPEIRTPVGSKRKKRQARTISPEARTLVTKLYDALKDRDALPADPKWFTSQCAVADKKLLQNRGLSEWLECLDWAMKDPWWAERLTTISQLGRTVWPRYARLNRTSGGVTTRAAAGLAAWAVSEE